MVFYFLDLFDLNFPKIQKIAQEKAKENVNLLLEEFQIAFEANKKNIDTDRFEEPEIQYQMQCMTIDVARKGDKSNIELLSELMVTLVSKNTTEMLELIALEARKIVPLLSKKHIAFLKIFILYNEVILDDNTTKNDLNVFFGGFVNDMNLLNNISISEIEYIFQMKCIEKKKMISVQSINREDNTVRIEPPRLFNNIDSYNAVKNDSEAISYAKENNHNNIEKFMMIARYIHVNDYELTIIGRLIGWLSFGKQENVDINNLF